MPIRHNDSKVVTRAAPTPQMQAGARQTTMMPRSDWGAVTAAAGLKYESARGDGLPDFNLTQNQLEIMHYTRQIGWVGFYVLIKSMLGAMCPWVVEKREGDDWVQVDDPRLQAMAYQIRPPTRTAQQMRQRSLALQSSIGEHAFWPADAVDGQLVFEIASPVQLRRSQTSAELFAVATRRDAKPGGPGHREYPIDRLRRHWVPDVDWPDEAWTQISAVSAEMRLYHAKVMDLLRAGQSRAVMNGLLYIPTDPEAESGAWVEPSDPGDLDTPSSPEGGGLAQLLRQFGEIGAKAFADDHGLDVSTRLPFPFPHFKEPKLIDLGRDMQGEDFTALTEIVLAAARGLNIPTQFLVGGEASTNHWNDAELRRALHERAVFPELEANNDFWSQMAFRPLLAFSRQGRRILLDDDPMDYRLGNDRSVLEVKSDSLAHLQFAWQAGIAGRDAVADKLGIAKSEMLELPINVTDWEAWLYSSVKASRAQAEVNVDYPEFLDPKLQAPSDPATAPELGGDVTSLPTLPGSETVEAAARLIEAAAR